ncbi:glycosyltransferase BC10-like [Macadamia integrifolia]|uniref:glycosyltransferase BC10-like n=1 Tax=Macadamia integrifolia TaxID=60698 RepID=UPI001C4F04CA|nr:glycosyltransferase BC10-like [Macadamia integrifolia]
MIAPTPVSLCCALLLCLPLTIVFTITSPIVTTIVTITHYDSYKDPARNFVPISNNKKKFDIKHRSVVWPPPSLSPPPSPLQPPLPEDDESLFRLAARVNPKPQPLGTPKKLAFMFLTTTPLPFAPLWELFFNQTRTKKLFNIYIHADPSFHYDPPFSGTFAGRDIHSKPTQRFTPSLVSAARRLLAHALLDDPSNAMFPLLSASCIPLHSFNFTYDTLIRSKKSFIEILSSEPGAYGRYIARGEDAMFPEVPFEDFRIGSQFFVLTRRHARLVVKDELLWSKFKLPCVQWDTCYPEENYLPTLLSMMDRRGCVPATLTHVDWTNQSDGHPRKYEASEVRPGLIVSLRGDRPRYGDDGGGFGNVTSSSLSKRHDPFLFARKFSPESLQPLMRIADDVIFHD